MTPVLRALTAALFGLLLGAGPAGAQTTPAPTPAPGVEESAVFTGRFVRMPRVELEDGVVVRRYQVSVDEVFGPVSITTTRVTVRARQALESCDSPPGTTQDPPSTPDQPDQPSPAAPTTSAPAVIDKQTRLFDATVDGAEYVVATCADAVLATSPLLAQVTAELGGGRAPGAEEEPVTPLEDVGFTCPDTKAAVDPSASDATADCAALGDGRSFDRAAAPGLALVIVGLLGLLVARRLGRRA